MNLYESMNSFPTYKKNVIFKKTGVKIILDTIPNTITRNWGFKTKTKMFN